MEENQQGEQQEMEQAIQPIVEMGSSTIRTGRGTVHVLTIVGQIEGHQLLPPTSKSTKYEHVMPLLAMVEESEEVDGLLVLLNTVGGDIEAGLGIAELIASMSKPTVSLVLGGGPVSYTHLVWPPPVRWERRRPWFCWPCCGCSQNSPGGRKRGGAQQQSRA